MTRGERRRRRKRKIKQRADLMLNIDSCSTWNPAPIEELISALGMLANNNYVNGLGNGRKTNVRKKHSRYRHKGGYGKDKQWKPHDERQVEDMDQQIDDYREDCV